VAKDKKKVIGCRLLEVRLRDLLIDNQQEFADLLKINRQQYNRYEKEGVAPSLETALIIRDRVNDILKSKNIDKKYTVDDLFYLAN
jgi:DNA-binding XRE family transcriptional regulator